MDTAQISLLQKWIAATAVGASALRKQGARGVIRAAQEHLASVDLKRFSTSSQNGFRCALDNETERLRQELPRNARHWGAARKALNVFLRDAFYNHYLRKHFSLTRAEQFYEVALDSYVVAGLKRHSLRGELPRWYGVKNLTPEVSKGYQNFALLLAKRKGIARVHLDAELWLAGKSK